MVWHLGGSKLEWKKRFCPWVLQGNKSFGAPFPGKQVSFRKHSSLGKRNVGHLLLCPPQLVSVFSPCFCPLLLTCQLHSIIQKAYILPDLYSLDVSAVPCFLQWCISIKTDSSSLPFWTFCPILPF